ncbi:MAG: hypothetical protein NVSMB23_01760 [Myxococcales bacterium]
MLSVLAALLALLTAPAGSKALPPPAAPAPAAALKPGAGAAEVAWAPLASAEVLAALGPFAPEVGAWAEYRVRPAGRSGARGDARRQARVRLSVLPPAQPGGRYWLELASATSDGLAVATRVLVHGDPGAPRSIERMIVFVAGQAAFEVPVAEAREPIDAAPERARATARVVALGRAQVRVPAGAFLADRFRVIAGRDTTLIHRAAAVPLWGLVRAQGRRSTVELLGFAHQGAHSLVPAEAGDTLAPAADGQGRSAAGPPAQGKGSESTK